VAITTWRLAELLVIGVYGATSSVGDLPWSGRRHDDAKPGATSGHSSADLFDAVFHALHDGEQVAVGFGGPLAVVESQDQPNPDGANRTEQALAVLGAVEPEATGLTGLGTLLSELGRWRPWTAVSTSLPRWRATTSILVWELIPGDEAGGPNAGPTSRAVDIDQPAADAAVSSFFERLRDRSAGPADPAAEPLINLAAAAAIRAGLVVDSDQLSEPVLAIAGRSNPGR
jgi:hypothetical protein